MRTFFVLVFVVAGLLLLTNEAMSNPGQVANCPLANRWSIATWEGPDATPSDIAFQTCGQGTVSVAYSLDRETQSWYRYVADRPEITTLNELDSSQGFLALGSSEAPATPAPETGQPIMFTGSDNKNTEDFHISGNQFRISFTVESKTPGLDPPVAFSIFVYRAGETVFNIWNFAVYDVGPGSTVVPLGGPGDFWLRILSANCDWTIEVKE